MSTTIVNMDKLKSFKDMKNNQQISEEMHPMQRDEKP